MSKQPQKKPKPDPVISHRFIELKTDPTNEMFQFRFVSNAEATNVFVNEHDRYYLEVNQPFRKIAIHESGNESKGEVVTFWRPANLDECNEVLNRICQRGE